MSLDPVALALLKEAFLIRQYGERAPGGHENWHDWERKTELYLRSLLSAECSHRDISWHGSRGECQECGENIPLTYYGGQWNPTDGFQPLDRVSPYPDEIKSKGE